MVEGCSFLPMYTYMSKGICSHDAFFTFIANSVSLISSQCVILPLWQEVWLECWKVFNYTHTQIMIAYLWAHVLEKRIRVCALCIRFLHFLCLLLEPEKWLREIHAHFPAIPTHRDEAESVGEEFQYLWCLWYSRLWMIGGEGEEKGSGKHSRLHPRQSFCIWHFSFLQSWWILLLEGDGWGRRKGEADEMICASWVLYKILPRWSLHIFGRHFLHSICPYVVIPHCL